MFRVLVRDNPWKHNDRREVRRDNPTRKPKFGLGVERRYGKGTMSLQDLCAMGPLVNAVTSPDCYLFEWATCPLFPHAIATMEASGFQYKTVHAVWVKLYHRKWEKLIEACAEGKALDIEEELKQILFKGPGRYSPANIELLLLGRKKGAKTWHPNTGWKPRQVILEPHPRYTMRQALELGKPELTGKKIHSRKPEVFQDEIEKWLRPHAESTMWKVDSYLSGYKAPHGAFCELFATRQRPGWECFGHSLTGTGIREDLAQIRDRATREKLRLELIAREANERRAA